MNLYKQFTAKSYLLLVIDSTPGSDNSSLFRMNLLERMWKLIKTIDNQITDEKVQYDINREAVKISALSSR